MAVKRVSKEALVSGEILFTAESDEVESISPSFAYNLIDIISLDALEGNPVAPSEGTYKVFVKTDVDGGFKPISGSNTLNADLTGGSALPDGIAKGLSFIGLPLEIKIVPNSIDIAIAYRVSIKQSSSQLNSSDSPITAEISNLSTTAAGELAVAENTPLTQINAQYGLGENVFTIVDNASSGTTTAANGLFKAQSGLAADGLAAISTKRELTLRVGQGANARIKAAFTTGVLDSIQSAGLFNAENALSFGFLGTVFGIIFAHDGNVEHQELVLTTGAAASESATVTINDVPFTVPLTVGTVDHNAIEIADSLNAQVVNYRFTANNNEVVALATIPDPQGSFAFSSDGTATGAWTQIEAGIFPITELIEQTKWGLDTLSDFVFDPFKLNGYQIKYSTLGALFSVVTPDGGKRDVHFISGINSINKPYVTSTSFRVGIATRNTGNTTTNLIVECEVAAGFIEGKKLFDAGLLGAKAVALGIGTSPETVLLIRNRLSFGGRINRAEILPRFLNVGTDSTKTAFFDVIINPTLLGDVVFDYADKENSIAEISFDNVSISGGKFIEAVEATNGSTGERNFNDQENTDIILLPGDTLAIVANVSQGAAAAMTLNLSRQEDF